MCYCGDVSVDKDLPALERDAGLQMELFGKQARDRNLIQTNLKSAERDFNSNSNQLESISP